MLTIKTFRSRYFYFKNKKGDRGNWIFWLIPRSKLCKTLIITVIEKKKNKENRKTFIFYTESKKK